MDDARNVCGEVLRDATAYYAEPMAAATDIATADYNLEIAAHAPDSSTCQQAIVLVARWLRYAQATYAADTPAADRAACAAATVEGWSVPVDPAQLQQFQRNVVYPFHGVLSALMWDAQRTGPSDDSSKNFLAVLGAVVGVFIGWSYIDAKQSQGGYSRSPAVASRPLITYRY